MKARVPPGARESPKLSSDHGQRLWRIGRFDWFATLAMAPCECTSEKKRKEKSLLHPAALFACLREDPWRNKKFSANREAFFFSAWQRNSCCQTWSYVTTDIGKRKHWLWLGMRHVVLPFFLFFFFASGNFLAFAKDLENNYRLERTFPRLQTFPEKNSL